MCFSYGRLGAAFLLAIGLGSTLAAHASQPRKGLDLQEEVLKQAHWRSIGPATMGGRIADFAADPKDPYTC
ncbi:MAG TPA: hypothetical protein VKT32_03870, partial [Chthonomonadaceae bacterium]|nr:hypothetical protein [Chthonomonadaceae bacterium]